MVAVFMRWPSTGWPEEMRAQLQLRSSWEGYRHLMSGPGAACLGGVLRLRQPRYLESDSSKLALTVPAAHCYRMGHAGWCFDVVYEVLIRSRCRVWSASARCCFVLLVAVSWGCSSYCRRGAFIHVGRG